MLTIGKGGYGLGVQQFRRGLAGGERAIGHGGGNIGTVAYMIHLPERRASIVVMVNAFNNKCLNDITEKLIDITVDHLPARGVT